MECATYAELKILRREGRRGNFRVAVLTIQGLVVRAIGWREYLAAWVCGVIN